MEELNRQLPLARCRIGGAQGAMAIPGRQDSNHIHCSVFHFSDIRTQPEARVHIRHDFGIAHGAEKLSGELPLPLEARGGLLILGLLG